MLALLPPGVQRDEIPTGWAVVGCAGKNRVTSREQALVMGVVCSVASARDEGLGSGRADRPVDACRR